MKISYDPKYDILLLKFTEEKVADAVEVDGGVLTCSIAKDEARSPHP